MQPFAITVAAAVSLAGATRQTYLSGVATTLPSTHISQAPGILGSDQWWARIGDQVFHAPPESMLELSPRISDYYYTIGSSQALTENMKRRRVGGEGRWHIFHLPEGSDALQVRMQGSRRESFGSLAQLHHGLELQHTFPVYNTSESYVIPGGQQAKEKELAGVRTITPALFKDYLTKVSKLGDGIVATRSSFDAGASHTAVSFLQKEFGSMGYTTCLHNFTANGKPYTNVVTYIPGQTRDSLTVGAHYDSRPYQGCAPGANDNGSGVSMLLSLAKAFSEAKMKPVRDLFFVGFAAEEQGLLGSAAYVPAMLDGEGMPQGCQPSGSFIQTQKGRKSFQHSGLVLDEVGWKSPKLKKATFNMESLATSSGLLNHLAQANLLHNGEELVATHSDHPFGSDHVSFISHHMESVLVINGDDEAYPAYHSKMDTLDKVDSEYAARISKMVFGGMVREAGLEL